MSTPIPNTKFIDLPRGYTFALDRMGIDESLHALFKYPEILTVKDVAVILRYTPATIYEWCQSKQLPHFAFHSDAGHSTIRFSRRLVLDWLYTLGQDKMRLTD